MAGWPIIRDTERDEILALPKWAEIHCQEALLRVKRERNAWRARYVLPDEIEVGRHKGRLFLFSRFNLDRSMWDRDFTIGLGLRDPEGREYRLVRCNGPHGPHTNRIEHVTLPPVPHVHVITEQYQKRMADREEWLGDGFAEETAAYEEHVGALRHLASLAKGLPRGGGTVGSQAAVAVWGVMIVSYSMGVNRPRRA